MSDVVQGQRRSSVRHQRSIYQVHYCLQPQQDEEMARPLALPSEAAALQAYDRQVAGHQNTESTKYLGLLQCNDGTILKPILKEEQKREVEFYSRLRAAKHPDLVELAKYTAKYYGCRKFTYNGYEQDYIMLEDLTRRMLEPCIMDVKIGKRTWDPLATEEKIKNEQRKYGECKREYGFCIPGYQVYRVAGGKLCRYDKDHGKKLHGQMVRDAIRNYLNGNDAPLCRSLLLQLMSQLWRVQHWAAKQRAVRLYSASLLLAYDAAILRDCCGDTQPLGAQPKCRPPQPVRRRSIHSMHSLTGSNFSGQITAKGPVYRKVSSVPLAPMSLVHSTFTSCTNTIQSPWSDALDNYNRNHSFDHNYEDKLSKIKMNYRATLDQLSSDTPNPNPWGTVRIIDFAHAFFNDEENMTVDDNFREGIDNFVGIFESFLRETDDQIF